jgi:hypothetical protein
MSKTTTARRIRRATLLASAVGALVVAAPSAAQAYSGWGGTLLPGQSTCVSQYASYDVRGEGTATKTGAKFTVSRNGVTIYSTGPSSSAFAAEFRTAWGNFPGPGVYQVCAKNNNATSTVVNIRIL